MSSFQYEVKSTSTAHLTAAALVNVPVVADITLPGCLAGMNGNARNHVRSITIISQQNHAWELEFWRSATHGGTIDADTFIGRWTFDPGDATRESGTGNYRYYIDGLDVPYVDNDNSGKLHLSLIDRTAGKLAQGAGGDIVVKVRMEPPCFGWAGS
jgi:hypothetical protein